MARKTKYNENFPVLAKGYAREGLTDKQIAAKLGVSERTYYQYMERYAQFRDAVKSGKTVADFKVVDSLFKRAVGYQYTEIQETKKDGETISTKETTKEIPPDVTAQIFWLKNRKPEQWREKQTVNIDYEKLSDEQLDQLLNAVFAGHKKGNHEKAK